VRGEWWVSGLHYARTSEDWLRRMDGARGELMGVMRATYGEREAAWWWVRWRVFFMACAELWGFARGDEWGVGHYLMEKSGRGLR
jgi:cyclopropane-fatty-acyl-phospholipid synthase